MKIAKSDPDFDLSNIKKREAVKESLVSQPSLLSSLEVFFGTDALLLVQIAAMYETLDIPGPQKRKIKGLIREIFDLDEEATGVKIQGLERIITLVADISRPENETSGMETTSRTPWASFLLPDWIVRIYLHIILTFPRLASLIPLPPLSRL